MAIYKKATFSHQCKVKALNNPKGEGWDIYKFPNQIKTASIDIENEDLNGFDLKQATKDNPDFLYLKIFAIKKDEPNDNGDSFCESELKKAASSFVGVPLFTNHQNDDVEKARGECVHSWYDDKEGGIYIIGRVDKVAYPRLARGIETGYVTGTSMGASRGHDLTLMGDGSQTRVDKLKVGDTVVTHKGNIEKIKKICKTQEHTSLYEITWNGNHSLALSYEHPVLILPYEDIYYHTKSGKKYRKTIDEIKQTVRPIFKEASMVKKGDYVLEYIQNKDKNTNVNEEDIDEDISFILGVYAAEGYISTKSVGFCFGMDEKNEEGNFTKLVRILKEKYPTCKIRIDEKKDRNGIYVTTWNEELASICKKYIGCGSHNKKIHSNLLSMSKKKQKIFLAAYLDGDGCIVRKRILDNGCSSGQGAMQASSASIELLEGVRKTCLSLGVSATISSHNRVASSSTVVDRDTKYIEHMLYIGNTISEKLKKYSWKAKKNKKALKSKFDSFFYDTYIAHRVKSIKIIDNDEDTYYVQVGNLNDKNSDHSYILNNIATHNCSVENSICSVCHNNSNTSSDYCSHVANRKNRKYTGELKCAYHNSPADKKDKCPICGSTKDNVKTLKHVDQPIFEHNFGLKFIENSFVVNPACSTCGVRCVLNTPTLEKKVASFKNAVDTLIKQSHLNEDAPVFVKLGGIKELESLKNSMTEMEGVVKSMLKQKENVSMEYVSELVKAMADVQGIFDELTEMGYGALPSPQVLASEGSSPIVTDQFPSPLPPEQMAVQQTPPPSSGSQTSDLGGLGNITMPKNSSRKIEDFSQITQTLINKVSSLGESLCKLNKNINSQIEIGAEMANKNNTTKVAAGVENQEIITEKQLMKEEEQISPRTGETYEGITESKEQIGGSEQSNDTTSDSPQVRKGTYETITEDQLKTQSALGETVVHFGEYPDVITEKQWTDFSRDVAGNLSEDYTESITQAQIRDLLSNHKFIGNLETITEDQLKNISMTDGLQRWANKDYSISLVKTATNIIADLIAIYRKSPDEIKKIASILSDDSEMKSKVAFLAVINSLPYKKENRETIASNASYFSKTASQNNFSIVDALIVSAASNAQFGIKAEDVLDTIGHIANNSVQMAKVNSIVKNKINRITDSKIVTKADAINSAIKELDKPEDGRYQIRATMEDIGVPITDKVAFVRGVKKFAQEMIEDDSVAAAVIKIEVGDSGELIIDIQDGAEEEISPDDIGDIIEGPIEAIDADMNGECPFKEEKEDGIEDGFEDDGDENEGFEEEESEEETSECMAEAKKEIKTAQMMGGEMGGQAGAAQGPGAGATLPGTPGVGAPPMESFTEDPGMEEGGDELEDNLEPLPPGSICPVCGSDDVDVLDGKGKCGNCGSEMTYKVEVNVTKWQGVTPSESGEEGEEVEEGFEGEGFEMPTETGLGEGPGNMESEMGEIPAAASISNNREIKFAATVKLLPSAVKKVAEAKLTVGSISPATGKPNTVNIGEGNHICLDTGIKYKVSYMVSKDAKKVYAQWEWAPRTASTICPSCDRAKQRFVKALSNMKITEADFDNMELKDQVETIIKLKQAGSLKTIKTASKEGSVVEDYKLAYGGYGDKFPIESCIEKLARRFGENAVCLSGPDEGKPLAQSVCNRLKKADVYTSNIAIKLADNWSDCDGDEECITHQVRSGHSLRQAAEVCSALKIAVAEGEDFLTDELAGEDTFNDTPDTDPDVPVVEDDVDPFDNEDNAVEEHGATVTLELPIDIVEQLEQAIEVAEGEGQEGIEEEMAEGEDISVDPMGEAPVEDMGETPIEESIGPDELDGGIDEMKPMEVGFDAEQGDGSDIVEKNNKGILEQPSKVNITVNGQPSVTAGIKEVFVMEKNVGKVGKTQMDLSGVLAAINKTAGEKEISQQKAQDSNDIGTYSAGEGGSQMGHENETIPSAIKPSVPRNNATMGQEDTDLNPQDKPQPVIPSNNATMGHEEEAGLSGGDNTYTGGDKGQGKTELASADESLKHMKGFGSSKAAISSLADRIAKKLAPKEPVADDPDIKPISDKGTIGKEEKFDAEEVNEADVKSDSGMMGHEKETLKSKPDSPKDHPDVFTGNAQQGQEELDSEKTTKDKGTVIAESDSESEAIRVAGRMLQAEQIKATDLPTKIKELKEYKPSQIRDIEKAIFAKKGLDTVSDGMSQSVQINETSNVRNAQGDLSKKLSSLFTLDKQNQDADKDDMTQLRKTYNK